MKDIKPPAGTTSGQTLRPTPIFDTNIFGHVQDGSIPPKDWRFLLAHRPGHGWPLSSVTALELLAGVHKVPSERFLQHREQVELAGNLSKGRIHEDPRFLICREVFHRPLPPEIPRLPVELLADYMTVVRRAASREEILANRVQVKGLRAGKGRAGFAGFETSVFEELLAGPKREWLKRSEDFADEVYPRWRERFQETGERLPGEMHEEIAARLVSDAERAEYCESFLRWLGATTGPAAVADISRRLDAAIQYTAFVAREHLTRNYNLEKHNSDVYDLFQLDYLAMDRFVIVSEDRNLRTRTARSSQAKRILSFDEFLKRL